MAKKDSAIIGLAVLALGGAAAVAAIVLTRGNGDNGIDGDGFVGGACSPENAIVTKFCPETNQQRPQLACRNGVWISVEQPCPTPLCSPGDTRSLPCPDESSVITEVCVSGRFQETNNQCPPSGIDPNFVLVELRSMDDIRVTWFHQINRNLQANLAPPATFIQVVDFHFGQREMNQFQRDDAIDQFHALGF